jgi:heme a synthase
LFFGAVLNSEATSYNPWHHRIAIFSACVTFLVLVTGALVTSEDAGLSAPDWPTSYGHLIKLPPWVGGIVYEHSHRMIAWFTGMCTVVIAFWTWFVDRRRWMKALGVGALGTIIAQGILGGMTVLHFFPLAVSTAHAAVGQTFFCICIMIAVCTGRSWLEHIPAPLADHGDPKLIILCGYSILILYVQLIFGGMFRHHGMSWAPHVINALSVALILTWTSVRAITQFPKIDAMRRAAVLLLFLLVVQLFLGFAAFLTKVVHVPGTSAGDFYTVLSTVSHVAVGALLLATTVVLTLETWQHVVVARKQELPQAGVIPAKAH